MSPRLIRVSVLALAAGLLACDPADDEPHADDADVDPSDTAAPPGDTDPDLDGCEPAQTTTEPVDDPDLGRALLALEPWGGTADFPIRYEDDDTTTYRVSLNPSVDEVARRTYTAAARCPPRWSPIVEGTLTAETILAAFANPQRFVLPSDDPPEPPWAAVGVIPLSGPLQLKGRRLSGKTLLEARFELTWDDGEVRDFTLTGLDPDDDTTYPMATLDLDPPQR